jgi:hypothetical protein
VTLLTLDSPDARHEALFDLLGERRAQVLAVKE